MSAISRIGFSKSFVRKISRKITQSFTFLTCLVVALQPMMVELAYAQEVIIDPSGNVGFAPTLQRVSRPQVVDIATPNSGGVSHNKYTRFDVTSKGVVLNNSKTAVQSRKAGTIAGNANLTGNTAGTIVNEVTSTRTSTLNGTVEVAGDRAGVIIANPNGITCNGCNFINASNGTLTTGVPVINGSNVRLDVTQGTVTIGRKGLSGRAGTLVETSNINLIGRTVVIDGKVTAIDGINVQGGAQSYDLTNQRRVSKLTGTGATPDFVVDGTKYGAMDAGRIQIIGNESGQGVRTLGAVQSTTGDVRIVGESDTTVRSVAAQGQVRIQSNSGDLTLDRDITSATSNVSVYARNNVNTTDRTGFYGFTGVEVTARKGTLTFSGDLQSSADVDLFGERQLTFAGYGSATGEFKLRGRSTITVEDATIVANSVNAEGGVNVFRLSDSAIFSTQDFKIVTGEFQLGKDVVVDGLTEDSTSNLVVNANGHFRNSADLRRHDAATINYAGSLYNEVGGIIEEANLKIASTREIHNAGVLYGTNSIDLNVAQLFNNETGAILSKSIKINTTGLLENEGTITSEGDLYLTSARKITNDGYVQAIRAYLTAPDVKNAGKGELRVRDYGQITASSSFANDGILGSLASFKVTTGRFENKGVASVDRSIEVIASTIINQEILTAGERITLRSTGEIKNLGTLASYGHAYLNAESMVENQGSILVDGVADIRSIWFDNKGEDATLRAKSGRIYAANIRNSGQIYLIDSFSRRNLNFFENFGVFASQGSIELRGKDDAARGYFRDGSVLVSGLQAGDTQELLAGKSTTIAFNSLLLDGRIAAGGHLNISGPSSMSITDQLQAGQNLYLNARSITIGADAQINAGGNGYFTATSSFTNDGVISLDGLIQLGSNSGHFTNRNIIAASGTSRFTLYQGNFENSGVFQTAGTTSIVAANITNTGHIQAGGHLLLNAQHYGRKQNEWAALEKGDISGTGTFSAAEQTRLTGRYVSFGDDTYLSANLLHVTADRFYNKGSVALSGDGRNEWRIAGELRQYGKTYTDGDIRLYTDTLSTYADSLIGSGKSLSLNVTNGASLSGSLSANYIALSAASISGTDTSSIVASDDIRLTAKAGLNHYGEIASGDDLILTSDTFDFRGNAFGERVSITGKSRGYTRGNIFATKTLRIALTGSLSNYGLLEAGDKLTTSSSSFVNDAGAKLSSTEIELRTTTNLTNSGEIAAASRVTLNNGGSFTNAAGAKLTAVSLGLTSKGFRNQGNIDVYGFFGDVNGQADNYGTIKAKTYFGLEADKFYNRANARLLSDGHLYVKTTNGGLTNFADAQIKGEVVDLRVGSLSNSGLIQAQEVVNVANVAGYIRNNTGGEIYGKTIALISNDDLRNYGQIGRLWEAETINLYGKNSVHNTHIVWGNEIRVSSSGNITNAATGNIKGNDFLGIKSSANSVSNYGRLHGEAILIEAHKNFLNEHEVDGWTELFVDAGGTITNRDGSSTTAEIKGPTVSLVAGLNIDNNGILTGRNLLGLTSENGRIYNNGRLTGNDITLVANQGGVYSPAAIAAGTSLAIEAQTIGLSSRVTARDSISLKSTRYDIDIGEFLITKQLLVDSARNVKARSYSFRGSDLTQIIAGDIVRSDTSTSNAKLGSIYGARGDIYVRLKSGSLGTWANNDGTGNTYEKVNWDVARSVSLIADQGNILLSGRIQADDDLFVQAKAGNTGIKDIRFDIGDVLHLEGRGYLKKNGWWNPASANKVQLIQNSGWFYTDDWLANTNVDYNLTVQAKTIIVNSSHRFVNKELFLRAGDDIRQSDSVISARKLTYSAGDNIKITFDPFEWRAANTNAASTGDYWDVASAGLRGHTLLSQGAGMTLYAGNDITLVGGKIHSGGNLSLAAGRNIISEPIYRDNTRGVSSGTNNVPGNVGWNFSNKYRDGGNWRPSSSANLDRRVEGDLGLAESVRDDTRYKIKERRAYVNYITARNDIDVYAGGYATFVGTNIESQQGDIYIQAGQGINFAAASGYREYAHDWSRKDKNILRTKYETWAIYQYDDIYTAPVVKARNGKVSLVSEGDILSAGTQITAGGDLLIASRQRNITLGTYEERYARIGKYTKKKSTFGGLINLGGSNNTISVDAKINTGNDFRADSQLTLKAENDIRIIGGRYQARKVVLDVGRDLYIDGAINSIRQESFTEKTNFITITTIQEGFDTESVSLPEIISTEAPEFNIGGETHIAGWRGQNLNASLLRTISTRDFDNALVNLYTPQDSADAATAAQAIDQKYLRDFDLPGASDGQQFAYLDTLIQDYGATYHTIQLRDHEWYDKQVRLNPAFQALLQAVATYVTAGAGAGLGISNAFVAAGVDAAVANLVSGVVGGTITGEIDLDEILRGAVLAGVSTTISGFLTDKINLGSGLSDTSPFVNDVRATFTASAIVDRAGDAVINKVVTNVVYGEDPFANFDDLGRTFLVTETLAVAQFGIGELGQGSANWEGSVAHLLLHGGVGCVALEALNGDCAAGFFAGAGSSILAGSNLTDAQKLSLSPLIGALAAFPFANGEAVNVSFGGRIAHSAIENNYLSHNQVLLLEAELTQCLVRQDCGSEQMAQIIARYRGLSEDNRADLRACTTSACWEEHRQEMLRGLEAIQEVRARTPQGLMSSLNYTMSQVTTFAQEEFNESFTGAVHPDRTVQGLTFEQWGNQNCGGAQNYACLQGFQSAGNVENLVNSAVTAVEIVTPLGLIVDGYSCATNMTVSACAVAAASLVPTGALLKAGGKLFIRAGDEVIEVAIDASGSARNVTEIRRVDGPNIDLEPVQITKSRFGHTFDTHGQEATNFLTNRAKGSGQPQGQFLDDQAAARFIQGNLDKVSNGAVSIPVPENMRDVVRVIYPDGSTGPATSIRLVPGGNGVKTAYPEP
jgi:filamentous hemagglutinin family protein